MLARAEISGLELVLTEMNKADIGPALQSGTIDFGLCPAPRGKTDLQSKSIYSEPLFIVANAKTFGDVPPSTLSDIAHKKFLLVPDACGLADTVRFLFENQNLEMDP